MTDPNPPDVSPLAAALQQGRQAKALAVADVARALLLSENQINGLESDDYRSFYGRPFVERAVSRYAAFLGVDGNLPGPVASDENVAQGAAAYLPQHVAVTRRPRRTIAVRPALVFAVVTVMAVGMIVGMRMRNSSQAPVSVPIAAGSGAAIPELGTPAPAELAVPSEPAPVEAAVTAPASVLAPEAPPTPVASSFTPVIPDDIDHRFYLVVTHEVVVEAKDARGTTLIKGPQPPNMGRRIEGMPPFTVAVADENAVELYYRGQRIRTGPMVYDGIVLTVLR